MDQLPEKAVSLKLEVELQEGKDVLQQLANRVNELINHDFNKLITILYRMDVDERKLRHLLNDQPGEDAGMLIARLMIEREVQKIKSREAFKRNRDTELEDF